MTTENTSEEQVSEETVSENAVNNTADAVENTAEQTQALTEERVQQMIAQAQKEAEERGKELGKREMQAIKDREVAKAQREASRYKNELSALDGSFKNMDEDVQREIALQKLRGRDQYYQTVEQQEAARVAAEEQATQMRESLNEEVRLLGIDPADNRIDFAEDAPNYYEGRRRFTASLAKIQEAKQKDLESTLEKRIADMEAKLRGEIGADYVDTSGGAGVATGDSDFIDKMVSGELPATPENMKRFNKIRGNT